MRAGPIARAPARENPGRHRGLDLHRPPPGFGCDCLLKQRTPTGPGARSARPDRGLARFLIQSHHQRRRSTHAPQVCPLVIEPLLRCPTHTAAVEFKATTSATPPALVSWRGSDWERVEERTLLSTITWASDVSGDWENPAMWTGGAVPGSNDDAVISFSDITITHDASASDTVDSLNCAAGLDITSGSLTIDATSASQPGSTVSGCAVQSERASLQVLAGNLNFTGGGTVSGSITGAAGTTLAFGDSESYTFGLPIRASTPRGAWSSAVG